MIITASKHTYDLQLRRPSRTHEMRKKKRHWVLSRKVMCGAIWITWHNKVGKLEKNEHDENAAFSFGFL